MWVRCSARLTGATVVLLASDRAASPLRSFQSRRALYALYSFSKGYIRGALARAKAASSFARDRRAGLKWDDVLGEIGFALCAAAATAFEFPGGFGWEWCASLCERNGEGTGAVARWLGVVRIFLLGKNSSEER